MKKYFTIYFVLFSVIFCFSQVPNIQWQKSVGGSEFDVANAVITCSDGGIVFAGETNSGDGDTSNNNGKFNFWVVKMNALGVIQWQKSLGGTKNDKAYSIFETKDLGFIVVGYTSSNDNDITLNKGNSDFWVVKLNYSGTLEWQKTFGGSGSEQAYSVQQTQDNGYIIAGETNSTDGDITDAKGDNDFWILKLNSIGDLIWQKSLGGTNNDQARGVVQAKDGGYIVTGRTNSISGNITNPLGEYDAWVIKLNAIGSIEWQKCYGGTGSEYFNTVQYLPKSNQYILSGSSSSTEGELNNNHGGADFYVTKIDDSGALLWQKVYGGSGFEDAKAIATTADGGFVSCGISYSNDGDLAINELNGNFWLLKIDNNGNFEWQKTMGGTNNESAHALTISTLGEIIMAGTTNSTDGDITSNKGKQDVWIVKLETTETLFNKSFLKNSFLLYPNPVHNNILNITTPNLIQEKQIIISDINGKIVFHKKQETNTVCLESLAKGIYTIQVIVDSNQYVDKIIKK